jgi:hypothetical protein
VASARCKHCGRLLDATSGDPCPTCGSLDREISVADAGTGDAAATLVAQLAVADAGAGHDSATMRIRIALFLKRALQYVTEIRRPDDGLHPEGKLHGPVATAEHALAPVLALSIIVWQRLRRRL